MKRDKEPTKHHASQLFNLPKDADFDFFDANLAFDTPVFIDPFLLKNSRMPKEVELFDRLGDYFRFVYDKSNELTLNHYSARQFERLLTFHEPHSINMGYTEKSNRGKGANLTKRLLLFFLESSARKFVKETQYFPDSKYNPVSLELFTDRIGPDAISDITANLIMDYLIDYTVEQCREWEIPTKTDIKLDRDGFDFDEMVWKSGGYYELPENPLRPGEALILVPRRLLRGFEELPDAVASKVFSILRQDPDLSMRFASLLEKSIKDVSMDEIRRVILDEGSVHLRYLQLLEEERSKPYDFDIDPLELLADKTYAGYFDGQDLGEINNCDDLRSKTERYIELVNKEFSQRDSWKDCWHKPSGLSWEDAFTAEANPRPRPVTEPVIGRRFRGMGYTFFDAFPDVTFLPEVGTGNGLIDFYVIYKDCKIVIELKLLNNASRKGSEKIAAYSHGIQRQLPHYTMLEEAKYAYYVTGQHYDGNQGTQTDHSDRRREVESLVKPVEEEIKAQLPSFVKLSHINIEMMPKPSASRL